MRSYSSSITLLLLIGFITLQCTCQNISAPTIGRKHVVVTDGDIQKLQESIRAYQQQHPDSVYSFDGLLESMKLLHQGGEIKKDALKGMVDEAVALGDLDVIRLFVEFLQKNDVGYELYGFITKLQIAHMDIEWDRLREEIRRVGEEEKARRQREEEEWEKEERKYWEATKGIAVFPSGSFFVPRSRRAHVRTIREYIDYLQKN